MVAALLDACDVVLARPPAHLKAADARRLTARARERGAVLVVAGAGWPEAAEVQLTVVGVDVGGPRPGPRPAAGPPGGGGGRRQGSGGPGAAGRVVAARIPMAAWLRAQTAWTGRVEVVDERRAHARRVVS